MNIRSDFRALCPYQIFICEKWANAWRFVLTSRIVYHWCLRCSNNVSIDWIYYSIFILLLDKMKFRRVLKLSPRNAIMILLIAVIIWNEYLALKLKSFSWKTPARNDKNFPILIVADPQLIGYRNEPQFIGWLSRWDSDRLVF